MAYVKQEDYGKSGKSSSDEIRRANIAKEKATKSSGYSKRKSSSGRGGSKGSSPYVRTSINDPQDYNRYPELVANAGVPYYPAYNGAPLPITGTITGTYKSVPGICRIVIHPGVGIARVPQDALNYALQQIYTRVRQYNASSSYSAPDIAVYLEAMASPLALYYFYGLIYGLSNTSSVENRYLQRAILTALQVDYEDLLMHRGDFKFWLDSFATRINQFRFPKEYTIYNLYANRFSHVLKDDTTDKAQIYVFLPACFYKYDGRDEHGGILAPKYYWDGNMDSTISTTVKYTVADLIEFAEEIYGAIFNDTNIWRINTDLAKAYGDGELYKVPYVPNDASIALEHNLDMLYMIHNSDMLGKVLPNSDIIRQDPLQEILVCEPHFLPYSGHRAYAGHQHSKIFNVYEDTKPDNLHLIEYTRFSAIPSMSQWAFVDGLVYNECMYKDLPLDYALCMSIWYFDHNGYDLEKTYEFTNHMINYVKVGSFSEEDYIYNGLTQEFIELSSNFNFFPILYKLDAENRLRNYNASTMGDAIYDDWRIHGWVGQLENYGDLKPEILSNYHVTSLTSLFNLGR